MKDLLVSQYEGLRQEIMSIQNNNEKVYSNSIIIVGATWSTILTIIFTNGIEFLPGSILIINSIYLLSAFSKYTTNENRIANISSFIGVAYGKHFKPKLNWETKIGEFARTKKFDLGSKYSNLFVYTALIIISSILSLLLSILYFIQSGCNMISYFDLSINLILTISLLCIFFSIKIKRIPFGKRKEKLDRIWNSLC